MFLEHRLLKQVCALVVRNTADSCIAIARWWQVDKCFNDCDFLLPVHFLVKILIEFYPAPKNASDAVCCVALSTFCNPKYVAHKFKKLVFFLFFWIANILVDIVNRLFCAVIEQSIFSRRLCIFYLLCICRKRIE